MRDMTKNDTQEEELDPRDQQIEELTQDLQRTRADFENYRKRVEQEKTAAREAGQAGTILKLLPIIDTIERATSHVPEALKEDKWAQGIVNLAKNLEKALDGLNLKRIDAQPGVEFNPELHEAIQFDEDATGEKEVIEEELRAGYTLHTRPIRHSMVKVTRK
jgi:molecular chaperone GrpE